MLIETCPVCGSDLNDICYPTYPPQYAKQCFSCGWASEAVQQDIIRRPYKREVTVSSELSEYFCIPCNLCNKYFNKDGSCPSEIDICNSESHWALLLERIANEKNQC